jgi:hypothetical protein
MRSGAIYGRLPTYDVKGMKFNIFECVKCGTALEGRPSSRGGRPSRFCSEGCKVSAEAEMRRLNFLLRKFEEGRGVELLNGRLSPQREKVIAGMQARFDRLAGVPVRATHDQPRAARRPPCSGRPTSPAPAAGAELLDKLAQ